MTLSPLIVEQHWPSTIDRHGWCKSLSLDKTVDLHSMRYCSLTYQNIQFIERLQWSWPFHSINRFLCSIVYLFIRATHRNERQEIKFVSFGFLSFFNRLPLDNGDHPRPTTHRIGLQSECPQYSWCKDYGRFSSVQRRRNRIPTQICGDSWSSRSTDHSLVHCWWGLGLFQSFRYTIDTNSWK